MYVLFDERGTTPTTLFHHPVSTPVSQPWVNPLFHHHFSCYLTVKLMDFCSCCVEQASQLLGLRFQDSQMLQVPDSLVSAAL